MECVTMETCKLENESSSDESCDAGVRDKLLRNGVDHHSKDLFSKPHVDSTKERYVRYSLNAADQNLDEQNFEELSQPSELPSTRENGEHSDSSVVANDINTDDRYKTPNLRHRIQNSPIEYIQYPSHRPMVENLTIIHRDESKYPLPTATDDLIKAETASADVPPNDETSESSSEEEMPQANAKYIIREHTVPEPPAHDRVEYREVDEKFEVKRSQLKIGKFLGDGFFSVVHKGTLTFLELEVAVKMPKIVNRTGIIETPKKRRRQRKMLRRELEIMAYLHQGLNGGHENVLKLIGAITISKTDFCVITEFCELGSMDHFLKDKKNNDQFVNELVLQEKENGDTSTFNEEIWKSQQDLTWAEKFQSRRDEGVITTSDLILFALQIARAMQFLAEKNVIHRDVALRNVLLKPDFTLKVADFGLSRRLYEAGEPYKMFSNGALPLGYVAIESIAFNKFTVHSDCWSFGVVVWELFTFASQEPYSEELGHLTDEAYLNGLFEYRTAGRRLSIPDIVPNRLRYLITDAWNADPAQRPSFKTCRKVIRQVLMQSCENILQDEQTVALNTSEVSLFKFEEAKEVTYQAVNLNLVPRKTWRRRLFLISFSAVFLIGVVIATGILIHFFTPERKGNNESEKSTASTELVSDSFNITSPIVRILPGVRSVTRRPDIFYPTPEGNGAFMIVDFRKIVYVDLISEKQYIVGTTRESLHAVSAVTRLGYTYIISLEPNGKELYALSRLVTRDSISLKNTIVIGLRSTMSDYSRTILKDEKGDLYCILYNKDKDKVIFFIEEIIVDDNGTITSANVLNQSKPWRLNGRWTSPFIRSSNLYWALQYSDKYGGTIGKIGNSDSFIRVSLREGTVIAEEPIANFDQCPKPSGDFHWQAPVQIEENICYLFVVTGSLRDSCICCIDIDRKTWKPLRFLIDNDYEIEDTAKIEANKETVYIFGDANKSPSSAYVTIVNFKALMKKHNPSMVSVEATKKRSFRSIGNVIGNNLQSVCVLPDGENFFVFDVIIRSALRISIMSGLNVSLEIMISKDDNVEGIYAITHNSETYVLLLARFNSPEGSIYSVRSYCVSNPSDTATFVNETIIDSGNVYTFFRDNYFIQDENGRLYLYANREDPEEEQGSFVIFSLNITEKGQIAVLSKVVENLDDNWHKEFERPFIFKDAIYWLSMDRNTMDDYMLKVSLKTREEFKVKFTNSLKYSPLDNDPDSWSAPVILGNLVFIYARTATSKSEEKFGRLIFIDMNHYSWHEITLDRKLTFRFPATLLRADNYQLFLYGYCDLFLPNDEPCYDDGTSILSADVKELVFQQKNSISLASP